MAANPGAGDGISTGLAGMSKSQLYDLMSQMKTLIEQNKQQARQILIQNPAMTRALFQAQIMMGMVQPTQPVTTTPSTSLNLQPPAIPGLASNIQAPAQVSQNQARKQQPNQTITPNPQPNAISPSNLLPQSQPMSPPNPQHRSVPSHLLHAQQATGHHTNQPPPMPMTQSSQPQHAASQPLPHHQPHMPSMPTQAQQPTSSIGGQYMPLQQPPLPPQPRPQMPAYAHQGHPQMGANLGYQHPSGLQMHPSQPSQHVYHSGVKPSTGMGSSYPQGQQTHSNQSLPPPPYQAGGPSNMGMEFNQTGSLKQPDRGSNWMPGPPENTAIGNQLPGPPPFPGQVAPGNLPARPPSLSPEMEKALLQQVMSLTQEQINMLPTDQRNQVLQLQQMMLRQ